MAGIRLDNLLPRHEDCRASLIDKGVGEQLVPVCMGGLAIIGCNNPAECQLLLSDRVKDSFVYAVFINPDNIVDAVTRVRRQSASAEV